MTAHRRGQNTAGDVRAIPFPEKSARWCRGPSEADLAEAYLERLRRRDPQPRGRRLGFAG